MRPLYRPRDGSVCSRGWLFMGRHGGPCDRACEFCYYAHQKNPVFFDHWTMLKMANMQRHYYGLTATDISGGEPTVYPNIVSLVQHCANIGLKPTIITHGQNLAKDSYGPFGKAPGARQLEDAGLDDWLVSLHGGSEQTHDKILRHEGSWTALWAGVAATTRPVRWNCTVCADNINALPHLALLERDLPPTVLNLISFNPFHTWSGEEKIEFQVRYDEAGPKVAEAVAALEAKGWEVNVRYWPYCNAAKHGFARNVSGFHNVAYDPWEWRQAVTSKVPREVIDKFGADQAEYNAARMVTKSRENETCKACRFEPICDKVPEQYAKRYGLDEISAVDGEPVTDVLHFQKQE